MVVWVEPDGDGNDYLELDDEEDIWGIAALLTNGRLETLDIQLGRDVAENHVLVFMGVTRDTLVGDAATLAHLTIRVLWSEEKAVQYMRTLAMAYPTNSNTPLEILRVVTEGEYGQPQHQEREVYSANVMAHTRYNGIRQRIMVSLQNTELAKEALVNLLVVPPPVLRDHQIEDLQALHEGSQPEDDLENGILELLFQLLLEHVGLWASN